MTPTQVTSRFEPRCDGAMRLCHALEIALLFLRDAKATWLAPHGPNRIVTDAGDVQTKLDN